MFGEFLFVAIFICAILLTNGAGENGNVLKESNNPFDTTINRKYSYNTSDILSGKELLFIPKIVKQTEDIKSTSKQTNIPLLLNLIINVNFSNEKDAKKYKKQRGRSRRDLKIEETKLSTTEKVIYNVEEGTEKVIAENLGNIFEKIKLRMELQRKKRNIEYQNNKDNKTDHKNATNEKYNRIQDISRDEFPKMELLNEDKEVDVTKWLKNWKDILAVNPVLSTDRPTKPEVDYIDEWKYSYRVTLYKPETYNISNFLCSGILVSSQWILTSNFCNLGDDVTILIGVHTLPKNILDHNRYGVLKKVYSFNENLELIQMDRPVQWSFRTPDIRALNMEEMEILVLEGKCSLLSWMPVDIQEGIFELRQYPPLMLLPLNRRNPKKNSMKVSPAQPYGLSKKDVGSPVLCDGVATGILLEVDEEAMTVALLCPVLEWITFFTKQSSYFEVTARKFTPRNIAVSLRPQTEYISYLLVMSSVWMGV